MAQAKGTRAQLLLDQETTFGSDPVSVAGWTLPFESCDISVKRAQHESPTIQSSRNKVLSRAGRYDVSGSIGCVLNNGVHSILLKHLLGGVTTTGAGPYTHTIKVSDLPTSLVIEKGFTDIGQYFKYNGCRVNSLEIDFTDDGFLKAKFAIVGAKETASATPYDATPSAPSSHVELAGTDVTLEEGGSSIATVTSVKLSVNNNLATDGYAIGGGGFRTKISEGQISVTGSLTAFFENLTLYNKAVNQTESSLKVICQRDASNSITFFVPELVFSVENAVPIEGPQGVMVTLPFTAFYGNGADSSSIVATVVNAMATL